MLPANGEPYIPDQQAAPSAGQPWGQPWGPGQQAAPAPQSAPAPQQPYGQAPVQGQNYGQEPGAGQNYGQLPGQNYSQGSGQSFGQGPGQNYGQAPSQGYGYPPAQDAGAPVPGAPAQGAQAPGAQAPQAPLPPQQPGGQGFPSAQGQPPVPPMPPSMPPQAPAPQLPPQQAPGQPPAPQPYDQQPYGQQPPQQGQPQEQPGQLPMSSGELVRATRQAGAPLPPATGDAEATTVIPPFDARSGGPGGAAPLPPEAASRPESPDESTTMLRAVKPGQGRPQGQGQPMPGAAMPGAGGGSDSEATQLIPPVGAGVPTPPPGAPFGVRPGAPGDRPTPAEFDGLFRDGPAAAPAGAPDATAQLPRFEDPGRPPYGGQGGQGYGQQFPSGGYDQQGPYDPQGGYDEDGGGRRRRLAPMAIVGIVIVALAGAGLGVGWALSGGSSDDTAKKQGSGGGSTKAAKESEAPKATADPAEAQAKGLDALLGDSNNSRSSVIGAVNNIKSCSNLGNAAKDLRAAAGQRNDLVKRLQQLPVDKIPDHDRLTAALTKAWQSSAAADNHYAAWAGQLGGKKGCHKGRARGTRQAVQGNAASSQATQAKKQAAQLWNPLAQKYGLTERRPEQL